VRLAFSNKLKDDVSSSVLKAIAAFTAVVAMPNTTPPLDDAIVFLEHPAEGRFRVGRRVLLVCERAHGELLSSGATGVSQRHGRSKRADAHQVACGSACGKVRRPAASVLSVVPRREFRTFADVTARKPVHAE
jgi:hypothetical protein